MQLICSCSVRSYVTTRKLHCWSQRIPKASVKIRGEFQQLLSGNFEQLSLAFHWTVRCDCWRERERERERELVLSKDVIYSRLDSAP